MFIFKIVSLEIIFMVQKIIIKIKYNIRNFCIIQHQLPNIIGNKKQK